MIHYMMLPVQERFEKLFHDRLVIYFTNNKLYRKDISQLVVQEAHIDIIY